MPVIRWHRPGFPRDSLWVRWDSRPQDCSCRSALPLTSISNVTILLTAFWKRIAGDRIVLPNPCAIILLADTPWLIR